MPRVVRFVSPLLVLAPLALSAGCSSSAPPSESPRPDPRHEEEVKGLKAELEDARRTKQGLDTQLEEAKRELERKLKELQASRETATAAQAEARLSQELLIKQKKAYDKKLEALAAHGGPASDGAPVGSSSVTDERTGSSPARYAPVDLDVAMALVDGEAVSRREVAEALLYNYSHTFLDNYLNNVLALREAKRVGLPVTDDEGEAYALEQLAKTVQQAGGDDKFDAQLEKGGLTREGLLQILRANAKAVVAVKKLCLYDRTTPDGKAWFEQRARAVYDARFGEKVEAKHLYVPMPQGAQEEDWQSVLTLATRLREQLALGEDWNKVAATAREKSRLGVRADHQLFAHPNFEGFPELDRAFFQSKENELSQPIRHKAGVSIVQVVKKVAPETTFEQKRDLIVSDLQKPEPSQEEQERLYARLRGAAKIEKRMELTR